LAPPILEGRNASLEHLVVTLGKKLLTDEKHFSIRRELAEAALDAFFTVM
jgi:hypothetical protein